MGNRSEKQREDRERGQETKGSSEETARITAEGTSQPIFMLYVDFTGNWCFPKTISS